MTLSKNFKRMNANSLQPASISEWLAQANSQLVQANIATARLDALVLLADELGRDKSWLLAYPEQQLSSDQLAELDKKLIKRAQRTPLAYIRGKQEFFGRDFSVTPDVLVPRPETEAIIEQFLALKPRAGDTLADIGTGSGVIAITAKLEQPHLRVIATDLSAAALAVAQKNAQALGAEVAFIQQDLLEDPLPEPVGFLVANLPYVSHNWEVSPETTFEPSLALFAADDGMALIEKLIQQSIGYLQPNGYLILEADPRQHKTILEFAQTYRFSHVATQNFALVLQIRISV